MPLPFSAPRILVIGDVMTDVIVQPEGALVVGSDRRAKISLHPGGSGCNQAAWLAHFAMAVGFVGRVGRADLSAQVQALEAAGVQPFLAADAERQSGRLVAILSPDGERSFLTDRGANDGLSSADLPESLLDGIEVLHVSGYSLFTPGPREAVRNFMAKARERGIRVTVDPASVGFLEEVGAANFLAWTAQASMIFANADEAACLTGQVEGAAQLSALADRYHVAIIKRGSGGADAASGPRRWQASGHPVAVIDTTGAGDAFFAGFMAAHLAGEPIEACLARGNAAGATAVTTVGARPSHSP